MSSASRPTRRFRRYALLLGVVSIAGLIAGCRSARGAASYPEDVDGERFLRGEDTAISLSGLDEACSLSLAAGESIPPQAEQRVILVTADHSRVVREPDDLVGCVSIGSPAEALEYLRFFSSAATSHLFAEQILEVFPGGRPAYIHGPKGTCYICLPPRRWRSLRLTPPDVAETTTGYLVTRYVVRPSPEDSNASDLYRIKQRVGHDGAVELIEQAHVPALTPRERYGLAFPRYL